MLKIEGQAHRGRSRFKYILFSERMADLPDELVRQENNILEKKVSEKEDVKDGTTKEESTTGNM